MRLFTVIFLIAASCMAQDNIVFDVKKTEAALAKQAGHNLFKKQYGKKWCLRKGGFKRPSNWNSITDEEKSQVKDDFLSTNQTWRTWVTSGWSKYQEIGNTNVKHRVAGYHRDHLERGGIKITAAKLANAVSQIQANAPSFRARLTNSVHAAVAAWGLERDRTGEAPAP